MSYTLGVYYELEKRQNMIVAKNNKMKPHWRVIINSFLLLACIILVVSISEMKNAYYSAEERYHYVSQTHSNTFEQFKDLSQELTDLTTPDGLEYYVRNHYRAVSDGEQIVVVVDPFEVLQPQAIEPPSMIEKLRLLLQIP